MADNSDIGRASRTERPAFDVVHPDAPPTLTRHAARALMRLLLHHTQQRPPPKEPDSKEIS
ncbi:hypothetical protein [Nocardia asteroides]|uniref:hypothetical protein n=1 Tax=Nocardia asteroides TaxID=1824 RepID=UPI00342C2CED